jgi:PTS system nitrogen regulatory IIA component
MEPERSIRRLREEEDEGGPAVGSRRALTALGSSPNQAARLRGSRSESASLGVKITIRDAARLLGIPEKTVYRWIDERDLPAHRVHGQFRLNRAELLEWATAHGVRVSAELFREPEDDTSPLPTLAEALAAGGIHFLRGGGDRDAVLRDVVAVLDLPDEVDREFLYEVLLARENLGSTAVGDGIAIPHVRNPVLLHVRPAVALCFLATPIPFGALDGKPVDTLFVIVTPSSRSHLRLLSRLSTALHDPAFREVLSKREKPEAILAVLQRVEAGFAPSETSHS